MASAGARVNIRSTTKRLRASARRWCASLPGERQRRTGSLSAATRVSRETGLRASSRRGVRSQGAEMVTAGVIPTPAIAYVTRALGFDAGLVISASHNPFEDNGIKVFSGMGEKFSEALEREVEAIVADRSWIVAGSGDQPVPAADVADAYVAHTLPRVP